MPLNFFYTMVQKSKKWLKNEINGRGLALTVIEYSFVACDVADRLFFAVPKTILLELR